MKKRILKTVAGMILSMVMVLSYMPQIMAEGDISVVVDNKKISFDVPPQLIGGRTMVPLRAIFEAIGADVSWDSETQTITAYNEEYVVKATIDSNIMTVNGQSKTMDIAPMLVNSRTLVPARFVAEAFGSDVEWNAGEKTVYIQTKEIDYTQVEQETKPEEIKPEQTDDTKIETDSEYYSGTAIPTYTSITGVPLKVRLGKVYVYEYDNADTMSLYWKALINNGWSAYDKKVKSDEFTTYFSKGSKLVSISVMLKYNEVWIIY